MPSPDHLRAVLTDRQIEGWLDYESIEPFGSPVDDQRTGLLIHAIYQSPRNKPVKFDPCVPQWNPPEPLTPQEYKAKSMRAYLANGGRMQ